MQVSLETLIEQIVYEELKTRPDGLTFQPIPDSEGDKNRGWRVDKLLAFINGEQVGFINMSWIPEERFNREFPTIFDYLGKIEGKGSFLRKYSKYNMSEPLGRIKAMLDEIDYTGRRSKDPALDTMSPKQISTMEKNLLKDFNKKYGKKFKEFREHWMDKPMVDYIHVNDEYRRQGIAIALYEEGAKYLATMGLKLYASSLQQPGAKAAWDWLRVNARANVGQEGKRTYLSFLQATDSKESMGL